jgi:signal transduction histidine kinase
MSAALLVAGVVLVIVNDVGSAVATLAGAPPLEFALLLGVAAVGAAALHPSMRALTEPWDPAAAPAQPSLDWAEVLSLVTVTLLVIAVVLAPLPLDLLLPPRAPPTAVLAIALVAVALPIFAYIAEQTLSATAQVRRYRRLLAETMRAKEHERQQIAADLHDGTIQRLAAMGFTAERVRRRLARGAVDDADRLVGELAGELEREVAELRGVAVQLRPPVLEALGLAQALREHVDSFQQRTGIRCELDLGPDLDLDLERETILYWAVQELLLNVAKHARARHAWIRLDVAGGTAWLSIRDDGAGFDPEALGDLLGQRQFGLTGTRDRVEMVSGTLRIDSQPGQGTTVSISLPPPPS